MNTTYVVDANILFSAIIKQDGKTSKLLLSPEISLVAPIFLLDELEKYSSLFEKKGILYKEYVDLL